MTYHEFEFETIGAAEVIHVKGDLDLNTGPVLRNLVLRLVNEGHAKLIIDLAETQFVDTTALAVLVGAKRRTYGMDGWLSVVCVPGPVQEVIRLAGLIPVLDVHKSLFDALSSRGIERS